ncbi:Hypothetical predicted protein [Pelobates cultripes]|uniref:Uncharacterized protein n=1 Tax=Pelobates cultripes TaxID=61616 RepID=A0AAD1S991_PELCU|nr:Hypothetical predicted protein [Pelobates cultripes]
MICEDVSIVGHQEDSIIFCQCIVIKSRIEKGEAWIPSSCYGLLTKNTPICLQQHLLSAVIPTMYWLLTMYLAHLHMATASEGSWGLTEEQNVSTQQ